MIRFTQGDMFETPAEIRVNTVNCVGVMGAGVALAFKNRYPTMFKEYKRECAVGRIQPGSMHVWREFDKWIINFPTKRHWKEKSRYEDIEAGLVSLREYLLKLGPVKVALPALGCGHGGLDWEKVSAMIREHLDGLAAEIIVFDPADSHTVARKGGPYTNWNIACAGESHFPEDLLHVGIKEIAFAGEPPAERWESDVSIFLSSRPDEKETQAATDCLAELTRPGMTVSLVLGTSASTKLAQLVLEKGGSIIGWVPQGLDRYKAPQVLAPAVDDRRICLISIAKPHQAWNPGFATQSSAAALALSRTSLFVDPAPKWLAGLSEVDFSPDTSRLFYIRYQSASPELTRQWQEIHARPIGRRSSDGRPNMDPIKQSIDDGEAVQVAVSSTATEPDHVLREEPTHYCLSNSSMPTSYPKRLIEVDLPIRRISAHARREKSIRNGHISTLHIWWARRPLAACRAVICASLWPDPADPLCPAAFIEVAKKEMREWTTHERQSLLSEESRKRFAPARTKKKAFDDLIELRGALLDFIADFANWDSATVREYLDTSGVLTQTAHESLGGAPGTRPLVVDPFCGGGSIPLEALRIGADTFASDLNPVPVLLNKVVLEYIPKYGRRLADEVRKWGEWIKVESEKELADFYPNDEDGATPIAYLWARTIQCEGPGCGAEVPLIRAPWLVKKANRSVAFQLVPNPKAKRVEFQIIVKERDGWVTQENPVIKIEKPNFDGTVKRGSATCRCCGYTTPVSRVRVQLKARRGGANDARITCVVMTRINEHGRLYRVATEADYAAIHAASEELERRKSEHQGEVSLVPDEPTPLGGGSGAGRAFSQRNYGMDLFEDLFTHRQLLVLTTLARLVRIVGEKLRLEHTEQAFSDAVQTVLAQVVNKQADYDTSLCSWHYHNREKVNHTFHRQAIPMVWDFVEPVFFGTGAGSWPGLFDWTMQALEKPVPLTSSAHVEIADAAAHPLPNDSAQAFVTDPPYYDAVPYSDLSDFFYVWFKRTLPENAHHGFASLLTPKNEECIVDEVKGKDAAYFEMTMKKAMTEGRRVLAPSGVGIVVFAHKSTAGWEAQLQAMVDAGWIITGSWPIDTEMGTRLRAQGSAALASSVHLVCRPRETSDGLVRTDEIGDWRDVLQELPLRIHEWMPRLAEEGVVGADAIFACLGPALEIYSRYSSVEKASGNAVTLKEYLEHVWAAVSKEALSVIFAGADTEGFEPDARLTAMWLWTLSGAATDAGASDDDDDSEDDDGSTRTGKKKGGFSLEYDAARKIAQGLGAHLEDLRNMVEVAGETARLLPVAERTAYLFGKEQAEEPLAAKRKKKQDLQPDLFAELAQEGVSEKLWIEKTVSKIGETTLDRIHQSMILFAASRSESLKRFLVEDGAGRDQRFWRLAQALSALYPPKCEEKRWVDGVLARKKGLGL